MQCTGLVFLVWLVRAQGLMDAILLWDIDPQYEPTAALNGDTGYCVTELVTHLSVSPSKAVGSY